MDKLDGKIAIVTGAGRGIGAGIALELATRGATLALMGRTAGLLQESAESVRRSCGGEVSVHPGDVTDEKSVESVLDSVLQKYGRIDVLINNAGIVDQAEFLDIGMAGWNSVIATNLTGVFLMTQRVARRMRTTGGGAVVNIASIDAYGTDGPQASYTVAKAGVIGLTKTAATELAANQSAGELGESRLGAHADGGRFRECGCDAISARQLRARPHAAPGRDQ